MDKILSEILNKIIIASKENNTDYFCIARDIFQARLDTYVLRSKEYLLSAIIGEIGNNTFDHNWEFAKGQTRGVYFNYDIPNKVILADFGRGIKKSLENVKKCNTDLEALKVAFTEQISGRAPEQRGNGLKFVLETVVNKKWFLYFHSGNACCIIKNGIVEFKESDKQFEGCFAVIKQE